MFKLLINHCNTKKFNICDEPPNPPITAPIILFSIPLAIVVKDLERSCHTFSYYVELTVRWWRWSRCILKNFLLNRDYKNRKKNSLNYNSCFRNSRRHDKVSRRHSELAPGFLEPCFDTSYRFHWYIACRTLFFLLVERFQEDWRC